MINNMNSKYKVGYLVPVYNHDEYILILLDSILEDAKKIKFDAEIVIIDDGSTDCSNLKILDWIENNNELIEIKYTSRKNKGLTSTLNDLISCSVSEYLRLCASDDVLIPSSTNTMLEIFSKNKYLSAICGDAIVIDQHNKEIYTSSIEYHGGNIDKLIDKKKSYDELILHWCIAGPCCLIKREFYNNFNYKENETIDDYFLYLALIEKEGLKIIKDKVSYYRIHSNNTSKTLDKTKKIINLKSFLKIINDFKSLEVTYSNLAAIKYLTKGKIAYLEKNYFRCLLNLIKHVYIRIFK